MPALAAVLPAVASGAALAAGSNYGITPGARDIVRRVSGWTVPTPEFAREPAPGPNGGPYAVTVDGAGRLSANEIRSDTVAVLDPARGKSGVITLPSANTGIRKAIIDASGRYRYMASHIGKTGVIE